MRKLVYSLLFATLLAGGPACAEDGPDTAVWSHPAHREALPATSFEDLSGSPVALPPGPVLLHFWATWCGPCLEELPAIDHLAATLAPLGITVLAISEDKGGGADVQPFLARHAAMSHLKVVIDSGRHTARALKIGVLPTTILVGADGSEQARLLGSGDWDGADGKALRGEIGR